MVDNSDTTIIREINPHRRERFFRHLLRNVAQAMAKKNLLYRASFVKKIDSLRNVEHVRELKEGPRKKVPVAGLDITGKIDAILENQHQMEQEQQFERRMLSTISEREQHEIDMLKKVLSEERREELNLEDVQEKVKALQDRLELVKRKGLAQHPQVQRIQERISRLHAQLGLQEEGPQPPAPSERLPTLRMPISQRSKLSSRSTMKKSAKSKTGKKKKRK